MTLVVDADRVALLGDAIRALPRIGLGHFPTPLEFARRISRDAGGPEIYFKRDDATGLALGGNKVRMFEFVLAAAIEEGYDTILGGAAIPANYCRQLAGACARLGLDCVMVFGRRPAGRREREHDDLMVYLARLFGARAITIDADWLALDAGLDRVEAELEADGRRVLRLQGADHRRQSLWTRRFGLHAVGYCAMLLELVEQLEQRELTVDELWLCSSEATQAGLALANEYLGRPLRVRGVSPAGTRKPGGWSADIAEIANEASEVLGLDLTVDASQIESVVDFEADEEGQVTDKGLAVVRRIASLEGVLLDPVYTAKAMAALLERIELGQGVQDLRRVVFLHTGGTPSAFGYAPEISRGLP